MKVQQRLMVKECIDEIGDEIDNLSRIFYRELFHINIHLESVFSGNSVFLNRKFSNLLGTLKNVKHLEKISTSLEQMGERHIHQYGAQVNHFPDLKQALLMALEQHLGDKFNAELKTAWDSVYDDVAAIMRSAMEKVERRETPRSSHDEDTYAPDLLAEVGGAEIVKNVHQRFYDVIFEHEWLGKFFYGKHKHVLVEKQTQFMVGAFGGPNNYMGDTPAFVHMHMYITDEMADLRESLLHTAILEEGLSESIAERWLKVDAAFRSGIVKKSVDECVMKCQGQMPIIAKKPQT